MPTAWASFALFGWDFSPPMRNRFLLIISSPVKNRPPRPGRHPNGSVTIGPQERVQYDTKVCLVQRLYSLLFLHRSTFYDLCHRQSTTSIREDAPVHCPLKRGLIALTPKRRETGSVPHLCHVLIESSSSSPPTFLKLPGPEHRCPAGAR